MKLKGIYGLEELDCGCTVKHYIGGKTVREPSIKCTENPQHKKSIKHVCSVCGLITNKIGLKSHKWKHAK
jgi:hypothetical protein